MRTITCLAVILAILILAGCGGDKVVDVTAGRLAALEQAIKTLQTQAEADQAKTPPPDPTARIAELERAAKEAQLQREEDAKRIAQLEATNAGLKEVVAGLTNSVRELEAKRLISDAFESVDVKSQNFTLVDKDSKPRARLGFAEAGQPGLWLLDEDGRPGASLGASGRGWALVFHNESGAFETALESGAGGSSLILAAGQGSRGVVLAAAPAGACAVSIVDANGAARAAMNLDDSNDASVIVRDANRTLRAVLGKSRVLQETAGGRPLLPDSSLALFGRDGKLTWQAP